MDAKVVIGEILCKKSEQTVHFFCPPLARTHYSEFGRVVPTPPSRLTHNPLIISIMVLNGSSRCAVTLTALVLFLFIP